MRKLLLSLLLLVVFSPLALRADEVIVGNGSSYSNAVPFNNMKTDSYTQSIYPMGEIGGAKTITAVAFSCNTSANMVTSNVKIYVGETEEASCSDWLTGLTLVYEGTNVTLGGKDWVDFSFNTTYNYSGTKNLVIAVSTSGTTALMALTWNTVTEYDYKRSMVNSVVSSEPEASPSLKSFRPIIRLTVVDEEGGDDETEEPEEDPVVQTLEAPVVTATATSATTIELSWNAVADSATYQIYIGEEWIGGTYDTSFVVNNCTPATTTCCTVKATKEGFESATSEIACATTPAEEQQPEDQPTLTIPAAPVALTAEATSDTTILLTWKSVETAESYNVYFHQNETAIATGVTDTTYVVKGLEAETNYNFVVTATNAVGEGGISNMLTAKTLAATETPGGNEPETPSDTVVLAAPVVVVDTVTETTVTLVWNVVENATSYNVYMDSALVASVTDTVYTVTGLAADSTYSFTVAALNDTVVLATSNVVEVTTLKAEEPGDEPEEPGDEPAEPTVPAAPVVEAYASADTVHLSWNAVEGAINYQLYYGGKKFGEPFADTLLDIQVIEVGEYCFTITAINEIGESEHSNEACATIVLDPNLKVPAAPVLEARIENDSVVLTWNAVEGATYYSLYQSEKFLGSTGQLSVTLGLEVVGIYCFTVTAANLAGESEHSEEVCVTYGEGIEENTASFNIYPNPVNDKLYIETLTQTQTLTVEIYDVYGRQQSMVNGQQSMVIDVTDLNSGVYFVKVVTSEGETVQRFIKK